MQRGFTIVELIITITIMGILLTLAVVNLNATQVNARDAERKGDIEAIQLSLEDFYKTDGDWGANIGAYPSVNLPNGTVEFMQQALRDINLANLMAPGIEDPKLTFIVATSTDQTPATVDPQPTIDQYVYQPIDTNGNLCASSTNCRKYNLYYRLESDNTVYMVTSKHR